MAERLPFIAPSILAVALILYGLYRRHSRGLAYDRAFASILGWTSIGLATAIVGAIIPAIWLSVSYVIHGGRLEENLPPGYSVQVLLFALLTGSVFTAISATYGYVEHLGS